MLMAHVGGQERWAGGCSWPWKASGTLMTAQTAHDNGNQSVVFFFLFCSKMLKVRTRERENCDCQRMGALTRRALSLFMVWFCGQGQAFSRLAQVTSQAKKGRKKSGSFPWGLHLIPHYGHKIHNVEAYMHIHMSF